MNTLFKAFLMLSLMVVVMPSLMAEVVTKEKSGDKGGCEPPYCLHVIPSLGLQPVFIATASVAPGIGSYNFTDSSSSRYKNGFKAKANFINADVSLGWSFIDPQTDHFSHTFLLRGNLQSTLIPARYGTFGSNKIYTETVPPEQFNTSNLYINSELTRSDQMGELFYALGVKKHNFTFSMGYKQSEATLKTDESNWRNAAQLIDAVVVDNKVTVDASKVTVIKNGSAPIVTVPTNAKYTNDNEGITTKGNFISFGYNYQVYEAQNMRLGANVSYLRLKATRQINGSPYGESDNNRGIKWGIYLQGDMFKLDRHGKLTYTLSYDNTRYDIRFPTEGIVDKVQEKLQTLSFAVNYIFF